jgi:hypothetical protein
MPNINFKVKYITISLHKIYVTFEVRITASMKIPVVWNVTHCSLVVLYDNYFVLY